jgi:hypothetical protein
MPGGTSPSGGNADEITQDIATDTNTPPKCTHGTPPTVDGMNDQAGTSTSAVAVPTTVVINTSDDGAVDQAQLRVVNTSDDGTVDQAQLTSTLPKLLVRRHRGDISNVVAVILNGTQTRWTRHAVDYTGYATFSVPLLPGRTS